MQWQVGQRLAPVTLEQVVEQRPVLALGSAEIERIGAGRRVVESIIQRGEVVYGVNTGFGALSDYRVNDHELDQLQLNLVRSHAMGFGDPLDDREASALLLLRLNVLVQGYSGARVDVAEQLIRLWNSGVYPRVPARGSVGASGDLAPLAHLALVLIGEGDACIRNGAWQPSSVILSQLGISPLKLAAKEGLALLNGTQAIGAVGGLALAQALRLTESVIRIGAMTLEGLLGTPVAFDARIHDSRGQEGQIRVARYLRNELEGSALRESHRVGDPRVQDAYSLRCMPQVIGAALEHIENAARTFEIESVAATDNPLVFAETEDVLSGGNFHGAPLALALNAAAIALVTMMSLSERRIDRLVTPSMSEGMPPFLAQHPGIESGLMILHVSAVAALNEARSLAHPAAVDNTPTSAGKEDHVSMGMTAAHHFKQIVELASIVFAAEAIAACRALDARRPLKSSQNVEATHAWVRDLVPDDGSDQSLSAGLCLLADRLKGSGGLVPKITIKDV